MLLGFWLAGAAGGVAAQSPATEQVVRAAMVFNFLKFAEWPTAAASLRLCVASGDRKQVEALEGLTGKQVGGRAVSVVRFAMCETDCRVLYVDARQRWDEVLASRRRPSQALTIGAYPGFALDGGMIEIVRQQGHVRFDVNLGEVRRAGLRLDSQLLRLARQVIE